MKIRHLAGPALAAAALGLAACSSSTSTTTGTQSFNGTSHNPNAPVVNVTGAGVVSSHGSVDLGSTSSKATLKMADGDVNINHSKGTTSTSTDTAACTASEVNKGTYTVLGGTGTYAGATGHGTFRVGFTGKFTPTNGKCVISQSSTPVSGSITFSASGPMTVKS